MAKRDRGSKAFSAIKRGSQGIKSQNLPLSAIKPIRHKPAPSKIRAQMFPAGPAAKRLMAAQRKLLAGRSAEAKRMWASATNKAAPQPTRRSILSKSDYIRPNMPGGWTPPLGTILPACRFRTVTILECLRQICTEQKEHMRGPWSALLPTPLEFYLAPTMIGGLPYFSLTDSVNDYNGYTSSGGWLAVHASIQMTQPATVTEIGLDFEGFVWALVSGLEGGWFSSDEIGLAYLWSSRVIRSQMPGEAETVLSNVPYHLEYLKVDYEYSVEHVPLSRHVLPLNLEAVNGQTFSVDYVLHWDIDRSPGSADAAATFGATVWSPQPYIVYKSCHSEYRQVGRFYREAARQMFKRRA